MKTFIEKSFYIHTLNPKQKATVKQALKESLLAMYDFNEFYLESAVAQGMDSRLCDLEDTLDLDNLMKKLHKLS